MLSVPVCLTCIINTERENLITNVNTSMLYIIDVYREICVAYRLLQEIKKGIKIRHLTNKNNCLVSKIEWSSEKKCNQLRILYQVFLWAKYLSKELELFLSKFLSSHFRLSTIIQPNIRWLQRPRNEGKWWILTCTAVYPC